MSSSEAKLDLAFANKLTTSPQFVSWVLTHTKFAHCKSTALPLEQEQASARSAKFWWKHWWCYVPELGTESETDIFVAFEDGKSNARFALHIENKLLNSRFQPNQPEAYAARARHMLNDTKSAVLRCTDYETVLVSPKPFRNAYRAQCDLFGCYISHEDIAKFVPEFKH